MDRVTEERVEESVSGEISSKHLPAVRERDLPEPLSLRRILGPGVILAAAGIGSGEYVLWPYISQQIGLGFLWAALLGSLIMFFIATECIRYTLATGETAITGFSRLWKPWWIGFIVMAIVPNFWPGYATGAATTVTFIFGGGNVTLITVLALLAIILSLTLSPVVYQFMERAQAVMMVIMLLFIVLAVFVISFIKADAWGDFVVGFGSVGQIPGGIPFSTLAGAVAFAGAGGLGVVVVSNYVRDKGLGMGAHIPRITSPITGAEEAGSNIGYFFPDDEENMRRWRGWWSVTNREQFLTFFLFTVATILIMSVLAYATVFGRDVGEGFDFIQAEGQALGNLVGPWFQIFFWVAGTLALFSTNLGVWDFVGRISADAVKANWLRESSFWTESKLYVTMIALLFVFGMLVLLSGLNEPVVLLVITAVLNGVTSFIYCALLIQLNRFMLPDRIKMGNARLAVMSFAVAFYGFFFIVTVLNLFGIVG